MTLMTRRILFALLATLFLAASAHAGTVQNALVTKISGTNTLKLEDGITVKVQASTDLRGEENEKIQFADIPDPAIFPGFVVLRVDGPKVGSTIHATKVKIHQLLLN